MKLKNDRGVTGVDLAVSMVILMVFVSFIAALFYNLSSTAKRIDRKSAATNLAIEVIESMKTTSFTDLDAHQVTQEEITVDSFYTLTSKTITIPNGYTVKISIENPQKDGQPNEELGTVAKVITAEVRYFEKNKEETVKIETLVKNI